MIADIIQNCRISIHRAHERLEGAVLEYVAPTRMKLQGLRGEFHEVCELSVHFAVFFCLIPFEYHSLNLDGSKKNKKQPQRVSVNHWKLHSRYFKPMKTI